MRCFSGIRRTLSRCCFSAFDLRSCLRFLQCVQCLQNGIDRLTPLFLPVHPRNDRYQIPRTLPAANLFGRRSTDVRANERKRSSRFREIGVAPKGWPIKSENFRLGHFWNCLKYLDLITTASAKKYPCIENYLDTTQYSCQYLIGFCERTVL